jgi:hypothetical protein
MLERGVELVPLGAPAEDERVQPAEQAQRRVPRQLADERGHALIGREAPAEVGVPAARPSQCTA